MLIESYKTTKTIIKENIKVTVKSNTLTVTFFIVKIIT